jgi:hypothetical protein
MGRLLAYARPNISPHRPQKAKARQNESNLNTLTVDSDPTIDNIGGTALTSAPFLPIFRYSLGAPAWVAPRTVATA